MDNYSKAILRKKLDKLIDRGKLCEKRLVVFGASALSKEIRDYLAEKKYSLDAIIDNDNRKIDTECMGMVVKKPEDILLPFNEDIAIFMLSNGFYREMTWQLTQMGYKQGRHIFILNFKTNESLPVVAYHFAKTVRGRRIYRKLMAGRSSDTVLFLAPYTGTGDIYLAGLLLQEYLRQNQIVNYVFVVVNGACKKVAAMFDLENVVVLEPRKTDDIINCRNFMRAQWPLVILNDGWMREPLQWLRGYKNLNFEKVFRYFVFGLDETVPFALPPDKDYSVEVNDLFKKHGLRKGKTVVLSPYSNTLFELSDSVWEEIADFCIERGYTVCTNCAGNAEKPVRGTEGVFFSLEQAIAFMNTAGYFVGVRSGLCDIISSSSCKKVILYEKNGFFYKSSPYEYFSLSRMGLCDDALELEYSSDLRKQVLSKILEYFKVLKD